MIKKKQLLLFVLVLLLFSSASTKAKASRTSHPFSSSFGEPENHVLVGKIPQKQTFLSIGIPTVWRGERGAEYVVKTLHSLVAHSSEAERKEMVVFVLLADKTENLQKKVAVAITSDFSLEIRNGLIVLVQTPSNLYDRLLFTPNDFNDDYERVLWRQKQSVDFSFLFSFVDGISRFYLQLEDDVVTTEGKAFPNKELKALSSLFHLYFRDNPVDFSLEYHKAMRNCKSCHLTRSAPLFQHIGMRSSLKGKTQDIIDNEFERKEDMKTLGGKDIPIGANELHMCVMERLCCWGGVSLCCYFVPFFLSLKKWLLVVQFRKNTLSRVTHTPKRRVGSNALCGTGTPSWPR
eukprot:m.225528 g.225528  ORF g.225528 m.225528 type:complete len:348 (-) comp13860_c0_seq24:2929-3972(-)